MHPVMGLQLTADVDLSSARSLDEVHARLPRRGRRPGRRTPGCRPGAWTPTSSAAAAVTAAPIEDAVGGRPAFVRLFDAHSALATARPCASPA